MTKVFAIEGDKVRAVPVKAGASTVVKADGRERTWVEVEGGLTPGTRVVTSGFARLADGSAVKTRTAAEGQ